MWTALAIIAGLAFTGFASLVVIFLVCWAYIAFHPEMADARPPNSERV